MSAKVHEVDQDIEQVFDYACAHGWSDGLPIIPPTEERVARMMAAVDLKPGDVIAHLPPRRGDVTVEKLAVNAVMAGCTPACFPVIIAGTEACDDPNLNIYSLNTTTNSVVPAFIINGPIRKELDVNCGWGCLGHGWRANATIGRAMSLIMLNVSGRIPEQVCKSTHKQPGAYSFCFGEWEERSPWEPLHVERGFKREDSAITVLGPAGTTNVIDHDSQTGEDILYTIASSMMCIGSNNFSPYYGEGEMGVVLCPPHAQLIGKEFPTKQKVKEFLLRETSKIPLSWLPERRRKALLQKSGGGQVQGEFARMAARADQFLIVVAGGLGGYHSVALPTFGTYAVTKLIRPTARVG